MDSRIVLLVGITAGIAAAVYLLYQELQKQRTHIREQNLQIRALIQQSKRVEGLIYTYNIDHLENHHNSENSENDEENEKSITTKNHRDMIYAWEEQYNHTSNPNHNPNTNHTSNPNTNINDEDNSSESTTTDDEPELTNIYTHQSIPLLHQPVQYISNTIRQPVQYSVIQPLHPSQPSSQQSLQSHPSFITQLQSLLQPQPSHPSHPQLQPQLQPQPIIKEENSVTNSIKTFDIDSDNDSNTESSTDDNDNRENEDQNRENDDRENDDKENDDRENEENDSFERVNTNEQRYYKDTAFNRKLGRVGQLIKNKK